MELTVCKLSGKLWLVIFKELLRGKSLARILLNINLQAFQLEGNVLDLGSKSAAASYNRFLHRKENCKITYTDWHEEGDHIIKLNLGDTFPIQDNTYDCITCFNVLEHIYNYNNVTSESFRVLKSGGLYIGQTPFLINYHADPHDYFIYAHE